MRMCQKYTRRQQITVPLTYKGAFSNQIDAFDRVPRTSFDPMIPLAPSVLTFKSRKGSFEDENGQFGVLS